MPSRIHRSLSHLGPRHLDHLVTEFVDYYHRQRPHQGLDNRPPQAANLPPPILIGEVTCQQRLGGLIKHYYRKAA